MLTTDKGLIMILLKVFKCFFVIINCLRDFCFNSKKKPLDEVNVLFSFNYLIFFYDLYTYVMFQVFFSLLKYLFFKKGFLTK